MPRRRFWFLIAVGLAASGAAAGFFAHPALLDWIGGDWPGGGALTCVVPWRAGGSADAMARQLIRYWEPMLGARIIVDNRDGEATLAGTKLFLEQPPDGRCLYIGTQLYLSAGAALRDGGYDMADFDVINFQQFDPATITVRADSPFRSPRELFEETKKRPGELKCGLVPGGPGHIGAVLLLERLGLNWRHVTYDSGNAYRTALLAGRIDFVFSNANGDRAIKSKARVLAVADGKRSAIWPEAPTFNEALGINDFPRLGSARFVAVRSGVRQNWPERFARLVETYRLAFEHPEYRRFRQMTNEAEVSAYLGPDESNRLNRELHAVLMRYRDKLK